MHYHKHAFVLRKTIQSYMYHLQVCIIFLFDLFVAKRIERCKSLATLDQCLQWMTSDQHRLTWYVLSHSILFQFGLLLISKNSVRAVLYNLYPNTKGYQNSVRCVIYHWNFLKVVNKRLRHQYIWSKLKRHSLLRKYSCKRKKRTNDITQGGLIMTNACWSRLLQMTKKAFHNYMYVAFLYSYGLLRLFLLMLSTSWIVKSFLKITYCYTLVRASSRHCDVCEHHFQISACWWE